jgi:outer membrane receptor protein involved in Fe transport
VQYGFGGRGYVPTPLYAAAAVWNFLPNFHVKLNYATGFRPPPFNSTDSAPGGVNYGGSPNLKSESSQSFQGELNARLLQNTRAVRELEVRVDYSYTYLSNLITFRDGRYENTGTRGIHSAEAFAKLYLNGDHFLTASYTFLYSITSDLGVLKNMPNEWLSFGGSFNVIKSTLDLNANVLVTGAYQDPNRVPTSTNPIPGATTAARATDLSFDRLTPVAVLQLGFRLRFLHERLAFSGQFYNVLNQHYYYPDASYDVTPSIDMTPTPAPGFNFYAQASYRF